MWGLSLEREQRINVGILSNCLGLLNLQPLTKYNLLQNINHAVSF